MYIQNLNSLFEYYRDVYGGDFEKEFKDYVEFCKHLINDDVYSRYIKGNKKLSKVRDLEFKVILNSKK